MAWEFADNGKAILKLVEADVTLRLKVGCCGVGVTTNARALASKVLRIFRDDGDRRRTAAVCLTALLSRCPRRLYRRAETFRSRGSWGPGHLRVVGVGV